MKTSNFRHKVFCMAYELMKVTGKAFAVCLSRAWDTLSANKTDAQRYCNIRLRKG